MRGFQRVAKRSPYLTTVTHWFVPATIFIFKLQISPDSYLLFILSSAVNSFIQHRIGTDLQNSASQRRLESRVLVVDAPSKTRAAVTISQKTATHWKPGPMPYYYSSNYPKYISYRDFCPLCNRTVTLYTWRCFYSHRHAHLNLCRKCGQNRDGGRCCCALGSERRRGTRVRFSSRERPRERVSGQRHRKRWHESWSWRDWLDWERHNVGKEWTRRGIRIVR